MRTYLLAVSSVVSIAALTSAASAADMAPAPSVYDWSGVYIGLNAGVAWSNSEVDGNINCSPTSRARVKILMLFLMISATVLTIAAGYSPAAQ